jgi:hypothetical protein
MKNVKWGLGTRNPHIKCLCFLKNKIIYFLNVLFKNIFYFMFNFKYT